jgi:hypothetical protein
MGVVVVVVVGIDVVVSVIFTTPGPTGGSLLHANTKRAINGIDEQ